MLNRYNLEMLLRIFDFWMLLAVAGVSTQRLVVSYTRLHRRKKSCSLRSDLCSVDFLYLVAQLQSHIPNLPIFVEESSRWLPQYRAYNFRYSPVLSGFKRACLYLCFCSLGIINWSHVKGVQNLTD